jgi:hypothetical protein
LPRPDRIQQAAAAQASNAATISTNIDIQQSPFDLSLRHGMPANFSLEQTGHTASKSRRFQFKNKHTRSWFLICGTASLSSATFEGAASTCDRSQLEQDAGRRDQWLSPVGLIHINSPRAATPEVCVAIGSNGNGGLYD